MEIRIKRETDQFGPYTPEEIRTYLAEGRLDRAISHCGLIRYDAYNEMSGRQSTSIALLDSTRSGIVISSIHHRDQARVYAKQVRDGKGELELAPEEEEAVRAAVGTVEPLPALEDAVALAKVG